MSKTNRKRAARALAAQAGVTYQQALSMVTSGAEPVCARCGGVWGEDLTCERCTTEAGDPRPMSAPGPFGPGWDGLSADWRGFFENGYTPEDLEPFFDEVQSETGVTLVCVWDRVEDGDLCGDSCWYVLDSSDPVRLRELTGALWEWAADPAGPATPGDPASWVGEVADLGYPVKFEGTGGNLVFVHPVCPACFNDTDVDYRPDGPNDALPWTCGDCGEWFSADDPTAGLDIVWVDEDGDFLLRDGVYGNPGCDGCGESDAMARINGVYACFDEVVTRGIRIPDAFHCFGCGKDFHRQFADLCESCGGATAETSGGKCVSCNADISEYTDGSTLCVYCDGTESAESNGLTCAECGQAMRIEVTEVSHHVTDDGSIDYDADGDHVALSDEGYGLL